MSLNARNTLSALMLISAATTHAATFVDYGHAAGPQCFTAGINDNAQAVGICSQASASAVDVPWFAAALGGPQQALGLLASGQPCDVTAIANSGLILGQCADANNLSFSVTWTASAPANVPTKLNPLPGTLLIPLLRPADVQTSATALNQLGAVLAQSISGDDEQTVVLYMPGSGTPLRISDYGDNCTGVDVNNTLSNGYPSLIMNCLSANATPVAKIATRGTGGYVIALLPVASGASYCSAQGMNDQNQIVGTCLYPNSNSNVPKTAFWGTPSSPPKMLTMPGNARNVGIAINNAGHILARGVSPSGNEEDLFWDDPSDSYQIRPIDSLPDSLATSAFGLAHNDTVAMTCENEAQYPTACFWNPTTGTHALAPINGGLKSQLTGISPAGGFVVGNSTTAQGDISAAAAALP